MKSKEPKGGEQEQQGGRKALGLGRSDLVSSHWLALVFFPPFFF